MAYDNFPLEIIEQQENLILVYQGLDCQFTFYPDPLLNACRLEAGGLISQRFPPADQVN